MAPTRPAEDDPLDSGLTQRAPVPRSGEPTTMRLRGVGSPADLDAVESEHGLTTEDEATIEALRHGTALLVVMRGPNNGASFLLDDAKVSYGRHTDSDIFLADVTLSRRHAIFVRTPAGYAVKDVGSLNGTYVNRRSVDAATLRNGDEVQIGKYRFVYYTG